MSRSRRQFLAQLGASALAGGMLLGARARGAGGGRGAVRPNIVFLMADDHRAYSLGCMGDRQIQTPSLDRLAEQGLVFERCYATSPLCMASRATVMTGLYEYKTGCNFATGKLSARDWASSYPVLLRKAGYRVAFAGKWGFPLEVRGYARQFDKWGGFEGAGQGSYATARNPAMKPYAREHPHVTRALGAFGRDFIRESAQAGAPFCLSLSFKAPHKPHNAIDPEDQKRYRGTRLDTPPNWGPDYLAKLPAQAKLGRQYVQRAEWDAEHFSEHMRAYYRLISGIDAAVGMVVAELERLGVADNTVVIYTSDNGYFCGAHGLQGKVLPYDDAALVPLIVRDPRAPAAARGRRSKAVVGNIDFAPTLLRLAGLDVPERMDGRSLLPLLADPAGRVRESMLVIQNWGWLNNDHNRGLAVATEDWKYIHWCYADDRVPPAEELFDLRADPRETANVAGDPANADTLERMRELYDRHHAHWATHCVDRDDYTRHRRIFSRHVPWRDKAYRGFGHAAAGSRARKALEAAYEDLTGHKPPAD